MIVLYFLCFALFGLSLLNYVSIQNTFFWKASILTSEFGHLWIIVSVTLIIFALFNETNWNGLKFFSFLICGLSLIGFSMPIRSALHIESTIAKNLNVQFATSDSLKLFEFKKLFLLSAQSKIAPRKIEFKTRDQSHSRFDFYEAIGKTPRPWVVVIHGGGWDSGDEKQLPELNYILADKGYSVLAITYRLTPKFQWPTQIHDVEDAISFAISQSQELNLDPNNWAILGRSAGAQLAGVAAYTNEKPGLKSVILFYPATDLTFGYEVAEEHDLIESRGLLRKLLGGSPYEIQKNYDEASIMIQANSNSVPTLLFHGNPDLLCWYKHSERLSAKLDSLKVPNVFVNLPWGQHGFDWSLIGPGGQISTVAVTAFLEQRFSR